MIYTLVVEQSIFGVNRDFRQISMTGVPADIATVQWDTVRNTGVIDYKPEATIEVQVRDFEAEHQAELETEAANKDLSKLVPLYKTETVRKPRRVINSFLAFEGLLARWEAEEPVPMAPLEPVQRTLEERIPLIEVVRLLRQKGVFTAADIELLKTRIGV